MLCACDCVPFRFSVDDSLVVSLFTVRYCMLWQHAESCVCARRQLYLPDNKLTGVIPESIGALLKLKCVCYSLFTLPRSVVIAIVSG